MILNAVFTISLTIVVITENGHFIHLSNILKRIEKIYI